MPAKPGVERPLYPGRGQGKGPVRELDFLAQAKALGGDQPVGKAVSELVSEGRRQAVLYLDTGGLVKLYYPEPESAAVAKIMAGKAIPPLL